MFTGIITQLAEVKAVKQEGENRVFVFSCIFEEPIRVDQSIAHNGVCLTVSSIQSQDKNGTIYEVVAVEETLSKTDLRYWEAGKFVNTELCLKMNSRLDGHFVQGHVDTIGIVKDITERGGSWIFLFEFNTEFAPLLVDKGSITINGVSLTIVNANVSTFSVTIIPYTFEHTGFRSLKIGDAVNLEFDILGKYLMRFRQLQEKK